MTRDPASPARSDPDAATLDWLRREGWSADSVEPLVGDVSSRRYARVRAGARSAVLATYPDDLLPACARFVDVQRLLRDRDVRVPEILAVDREGGRMLLEDLGTETLFDRRRLGWDYLASRVELAAELAERIAEVPLETAAGLSPPLDLDLLTAELVHTWTVALAAAGPAEAGLPRELEGTLATMLERLAAAPRSTCHRDFMARNLIPLDPVGDAPGPPALAVLDFQDLRPGPHTYDLASLLNDSLYAPASLEESLLTRHLDTDESRLDYHRGAAQRTLKIVGTFVGFAARGFPRHLELVAPTLERARGHLLRLPEMVPARSAVDRLCNALLSAATAR